MDSFRVVGGNPLKGTATVNGSKNAALPIIFASLLGDSPTDLERVPDLRDTRTAALLLRELGVACEQDAGNMRIDPSSLESRPAPYDLVRTMRASVLALGPMLAKTGKASIYMPGGCAIGARPIDMHIAGLEAMGAGIRVEKGFLQAEAKRLKGCDYSFPKVTVTGTANLIMAACGAEGATVLRNAATEPEVVDLCGFLAAMGADIAWEGERTLRIGGAPARLSGARYRVSPDRIEAGTFMAAAAATGGAVRLEQAPVRSCRNVIEALRGAGAAIDCDESLDVGPIDVSMEGRARPFHLATAPYPGFPTDMQAQMMALACVAKGSSTLQENVFEGRFMHAAELQRMGADVRLDGNCATVRGKKRIQGALVMATDLRASACLVIAALAAQGESRIDRVYHLDRGYEALERRFRQIGGDVTRVAG